jgi:chromosomal replication initiation ATPase DnaA
MIELVISDGHHRKYLTYTIDKYNGESMDLYDRVIKTLPVSHILIFTKFLEYYNININSLKPHIGKKERSNPKYMARLCWLLRNYTPLKYQEIAKFLGYKTHSNIWHHCITMDGLLEKNRSSEEVHEICELLKFMQLDDFKLKKVSYD